MDSFPHPFLRYISIAREQARLENYESSLNSYLNAKNEVSSEVDSCRDINALTKWNAILKEIVAEESSIRRIKNQIETILNNIETKQNIPPGGFGDDEVLEPPQWSNDNQNQQDSPPLFELKAPEKRPVIPNKGGINGGKRIISSNKNNNLPQKPIQAKPIKGIINQQNKPVKINPSKPNKIEKQPQQQSKNKVTDPTTNPLVQQIIDMGILVREPNVSWDSIAGLNHVKRILRQNLVILPLRPDIAKGLLAPWKSVLFYGPPGTGKTFLAKAVATECKRTFFNITSATITSRFLGESEKLVSHLFNLAEQMAPSTIFFDEIDSIASQRGTSNEHEASRKMKAELLTKLEGIDSSTEANSIFVLAATNFPWHLDEALLRRFQKRIFIPLPDIEARLFILKSNINEHVDESFDFQKWAEKLDGYSCADITNLCRDAVQAVFDRQTELMDTQEWLNMPAEQAKVVISNEDFQSAANKRKSSVDLSTLNKYDEWRSSKGAE